MLFDGSIPATEPVTMGHEGVGYVERMGKNVKGFEKRQRVGFLYIKGVCCEASPFSYALFDGVLQFRMWY